METGARRMCTLLVGLPDVRVAAVGEWPSWLMVRVGSIAAGPSCPGCGRIPHDHGTREGVLVDLPVFGRATRLVMKGQRWLCPNPACTTVTWTEQDPRIASARCALTTRAARWATIQVGRHGRVVSEAATDLGCDWHTVMDAVSVYGQPLIDDPGPLRCRLFGRAR